MPRAKYNWTKIDKRLLSLGDERMPYRAMGRMASSVGVPVAALIKRRYDLRERESRRMGVEHRVVHNWTTQERDLLRATIVGLADRLELPPHRVAFYAADIFKKERRDARP